MSRRVGPLVGSVLLVAALAGCVNDQDPGLEPGGGGPASTSDTLGRCPAGGPDSTTPSAGCLDAEGRVRRP